LKIENEAYFEIYHLCVAMRLNEMIESGTICKKCHGIKIYASNLADLLAMIMLYSSSDGECDVARHREVLPQCPS
jgi:hypothetical protein